jgi:hypothetical protein
MAYPLLSRALIICAGLAISSSAIGQTGESSSFFRRLAVNQVTESEGQFFVRVQDQRLGKTQALERILIGRATVLAGHWLCQFTPQPSKRLEANIQGVSLVYSREVEGLLDIVIKLRKQQPDCTIQSVALRSEPLVAPIPAITDEPAGKLSTDGRSTIEVKPAKSQETSGASEAGIKVRIFSTEY